MPRKTVNSMTLPTMPTGQAHTFRRIPAIAEASPNPLPMISRHRIAWPATTSWDSNNQVSTVMRTAPA